MAGVSSSLWCPAKPLTALVMCCLLFMTTATAADTRLTGWDELVPLGWPDRDPLDGERIDHLDDSDPRAQALYAVLREYLDNAPVVETLDGQDVSIPGFVVPLGFDADSLDINEFLLVPFFGACIHVPPPASNQVVLVSIAPHYENAIPTEMDVPVVVTGRLSIARSESELAVSSYQIEASRVVPYRPY